MILNERIKSRPLQKINDPTIKIIFEGCTVTVSAGCATKLKSVPEVINVDENCDFFIPNLRLEFCESEKLFLYNFHHQNLSMFKQKYGSTRCQTFPSQTVSGGCSNIFWNGLLEHFEDQFEHCPGAYDPR